jgi:hypothetical protein
MYGLNDTGPAAAHAASTAFNARPYVEHLRLPRPHPPWPIRSQRSGPFGRCGLPRLCSSRLPLAN